MIHTDLAQLFEDNPDLVHIPMLVLMLGTVIFLSILRNLFRVWRRRDRRYMVWQYLLLLFIPQGMVLGMGAWMAGALESNGHQTFFTEGISDSIDKYWPAPLVAVTVLELAAYYIGRRLFAKADVDDPRAGLAGFLISAIIAVPLICVVFIVYTMPV